MSNTALFLFLRDPGTESRVQQLAGNQSPKQNKRIIHALNAHAREVAQSTGLPCYIVYDHQMPGNGFGERFTHAFQAVFNKGYQKVIALGNDHPELTAATVQKAAQQLYNFDQVLGPAKDGGLYLIGIDRAAFHPEKFRDLPWQTGQLQAAYKACLNQKNITHHLLHPLRDADNSMALKAILEHFRFSTQTQRLYRQLASILDSGHKTALYHNEAHTYHHIPLPFDLRGPPISASHISL